MYYNIDEEDLKPILLSKAHMQCILDGYPPYYRSEYILRPGTARLPPNTAKIALQNPIPTLADRTRVGWIIAVGRIQDKPVAFYVDDKGHHSGGRAPERIGASMIRVRDIFQNDIAPEFPQRDPWYPDICAAVMPVNHMLNCHTGSDLDQFWPIYDSIGSLDEGALNALISLFNSFGPLTAKEFSLVKSHTLAILKFIIAGVVRVTEYLKDRAVWLPK
jgi:hypothetical protein